MRNHDLPGHLERIRAEIEGHARMRGLDFYDTIFQMVSSEEMCSLAAQVGFPNRYPYWKFGMEYEKLRKEKSYGLSNIYELVVNTNPSYAYLLDSNNAVQQKLVMAHVYGHVDFFKNNHAFTYTNRHMMDGMANHSAKIRAYIDKHGEDKVEEFIDICVSLEDLIDHNAPYRKEPEKDEPDDDENIPVHRLKVNREYMEGYINPKSHLEEQIRKEKKRREEAKKIPPEPERDILQFLIKHANLKPWQREILGIIREEAYYFAPQKKTKIMNEGWAVHCHSGIMTRWALTPNEIVDYADMHSRAVSKGQGSINPYALGFALFKDIEERWNKGRHGREWEECDDMEKIRSWDTGENRGIEKIFEVRKHYEDITFLDEFMTPEFCAEQNLFSFAKYKPTRGKPFWYIDSKDFKVIKEKLLWQLTNFGNPFMYLTDSNYKNRGELLLHNKWTGKELDKKDALKTMKNLEKIWKRPVNIETYLPSDGIWMVMHMDSGDLSYTEIKEKDLSFKY